MKRGEKTMEKSRWEGEERGGWQRGGGKEEKEEGDPRKRKGGSGSIVTGFVST